MRDRASKKKLLVGALRHYAGETLFDRIGRAVCRAECVPRKELYESWEVARRVRRRLTGQRIVDLACGHGLVAQIMAILDDRATEVVGVDRKLPQSVKKVAASMAETWPHLASRVRFVQSKIERFELRADDLIVSAHACGKLTDIVLERAAEVGAQVAVLPCCSCHRHLDRGGLDGWLDGDMAIDVVRALRLRERGYEVWTQTIPEEITPKNRLLFGRPAAAPAVSD